jgi:hypothetical protein
MVFVRLQGDEAVSWELEKPSRDCLPLVHVMSRHSLGYIQTGNSNVMQ